MKEAFSFDVLKRSLLSMNTQADRGCARGCVRSGRPMITSSLCVQPLPPLSDAVSGDLHRASCVGPRHQTTVSLFGLNPTNTLKSFQDMGLPEDMKNKGLFNAAETSSGDLLGPPSSKAVTKDCRRDTYVCVTACGRVRHSP